MSGQFGLTPGNGPRRHKLLWGSQFTNSFFVLGKRVNHIRDQGLGGDDLSTRIARLARTLFHSRAGTGSDLSLSELESRRLYSATPVPIDLVECACEVPSESIVVTHGDAAVAQVQDRFELIVVDESVEDHELLVGNLLHDSTSRLEIVYLSGERDGVEQLAEVLSGREGVSALHVVSHGDTAGIKLGNAWLNTESVAGYAPLLADWSDSMAADADVLFYGCDLAASEGGRELVRSLSILTGTDVAASDDPTGHQSLGGDWDLEFSVGEVTAAAFVSAETQAEWQGLLAVPTIDATTEFRINQATTGNQLTSAENRGSESAVAVADDGSYVVAWSSENQDGSGWGVYARRIDGSGVPLTDDILVNESTAGDQKSARVVSNADGSFVVTWTSTAGGSDGVFFRRFDANGGALSGEISASSQTTGDQSNSVVALDQATGDFVIAWQGEGPGDSNGVFFRRFNADGTAKDATDQAAVTSGIADPQFDPVIAMRDSGRFVIAWDDGTQVYHQLVDADGTLDGGRSRIDGPFSNSSQLSVSYNGSGNFTYAYVQEPGLGSGVWIRGYDANGDSVIGWELIAAGSSAQNPAISMAPDGSHVVTWHDDDADGSGVFAQRLDASGANVGSRESVNISTTGDQSRASSATFDSDNFVVVWSGQGTSPGQEDTAGVFARQFGTRGAGTATAVDDAYSTDEDNSISILASGTLANDSSVGPATSGASLQYDAATDDGADLVWENQTSETGLDWDFSGGGVTFDASPVSSTGVAASWVFDGSGGGVTDSYSNLAANPSKEPATLELWFRPTDAVGQEMIFETGGNGHGTSFSLNGSSLELLVNAGSDTALLSRDISAEIAGGEFIQATALIDTNNSEVRLYVNGILVDSETGVTGIDDWANGNDSGLGQVNNQTLSTNTGNYIGEISRLRFYESLLTPSEIQANFYASGGAGATALRAGLLDTTGTAGQVELATDGSFSYDPNGQFEYLAAGSTATDSFTYTASDGGSSDIGVVTVSITGVNDQPTDIVLADSSINENVTAGVVGAISTTDVDVGDTHSYVVSDSRFEVVAGQLKLRAGETLDYESEATVNINVVSTDGGGLQVDRDFVISVTNVNEAPSVSLANRLTSLPETTSTTSSVKVADIVVSDDGTGTNNLVLSGADASLFEIVGLTGSEELHLRAGVGLDASTNPILDVTVEVNDTAVGGSPDDTASLSISISNVNVMPLANPGGSYSVAEGGTLALDGSGSSDADGSIVTYEWDFDYNGSFDVTATGVSPTFSASSVDGPAARTIALRVIDNESGVSAVSTTTVTVTNESPTGNADAGALFTTDEDSAFQTGDATLNDTDPSSSDSLTITSVDLSGTLGQVSIHSDGRSFNYDPNGAFESLRAGQSTTDTFTYTVSDGDGGSASSVLVTVTINGVNDQPLSIGLSGTSVAENVNGAIIGSLSTTDPDAGDSHSYSVSDSRFEVVGSQLQLRAGQSLDFESEPTVSVDVTSTDAGGLGTTETFVITVTDANEAPRITIANAITSIPEATRTRTKIADVIISDDAFGTNNLSLTGADAGLFEISGGTGSYELYLRAGASLDDVTNPTLDVTVEVDDATVGGSPDDTASLAVVVTDVNSIPIANIGGPYTVREGRSVLLDASASVDADGNVADYEWDLDYDGTFDVDATGATPRFSAARIDGPTIRTIALRVRDNLSAVSTVVTTTVSIANSPPVGSADGGAGFSTDEDTVFQTGSVLSNDTDSSGLDLLSITSFDGSSSLGVVSLGSDGRSFEYDPNGAFDWLASGETSTDTFTYIVSDDDGGQSTPVTVTITINGVNDRPTATGFSTTIAENTIESSFVGRVRATDADGSDSLSFEIVSGNRGNAFAIDRLGNITVNNSRAIDRERIEEFELSVSVTDGGGLVRSVPVVVRLDDVNDVVPVVDPGQSFSVSETARTSTSLGFIRAEDGDVSTSRLRDWVIVAGNEAGAFEIDPSTGELTVADAKQLDFETNDSFTLLVSVSDGVNRIYPAGGSNRHHRCE